jgi:hypothetical protein
MPADSTRAIILGAAERLYADRGFADVTLRDIVAAADVNLAAVNYHFGSKDELILRRSLPDRSEVDLYWGLHFALAMAHQTIRDSERLTKWSEGKCDLGDVEGIIDRVVDVSVMALTGSEANGRRSKSVAASRTRSILGFD